MLQMLWVNYTMYLDNAPRRDLVLPFLNIKLTRGSIQASSVATDTISFKGISLAIK